MLTENIAYFKYYKIFIWGAGGVGLGTGLGYPEWLARCLHAWRPVTEWLCAGALQSGV